MSCECINQGFFCREYWKDCPKCHGTGKVVNNDKYQIIKLLSEHEFLIQAHAKDPIVLNCLWDCPEVSAIHDWFKRYSSTYTGTLNFAYLNTKTKDDGIMIAPDRPGNKYLYFVEFPDANAVTYFRGYSKSGEVFLLNKDMFYS